MAVLIQKPTVIEAAGHPPKLIEEFIGRANSGTAAVEHRPHEKSIGLVRAGADARIQ